MSRERKARLTAVAVAGASLLVAGTVAVGLLLTDDAPEARVALTAEQYQGVCVVVTPPEPDPCDAASGVIRYAFFGALVNVPYLEKWQTANPGEVFRLAAIMAAPKCSTPTSPQPQTMRTFFGAALAAAAEAVACARHPEAIGMPMPNPKPTGTGDRTPPSAPGPITVTP